MRGHRARARRHPSFDGLERREALSRGAAVAEAVAAKGRTQPQPALVGDVNGGGTATLADLQVMARAYLSVEGRPNYNPAVDLNHDGKVNQYDARLLEKRLPKPPPGTPLTLKLHLAPGEEVLHPNTFNSGAITRLSNVLILGRTIPGALVFADSSRGFYRFNGPLLPTDADGDFAYPVRLKDKLTASTSFLVIDQFGRQLVRNFPILRVS